MAFQLSLRSQTLTKLRGIRPLSSSTPHDSSADASSAAVPDPSSAAAAAAPPPPLSCASPSSDIKDRIFKKNHLDKPSFAAAKPSSRGLDDLTSRFKTHSSIFGKEKPADDVDRKAPKTEKELREKLRRLLPEVKLRELEEKLADWIAELNDRLVKQKVKKLFPNWGSIFGKEKPTDVVDPEIRRFRPDPEIHRLRTEVQLRQLEEKLVDSTA